MNTTLAKPDASKIKSLSALTKWTVATLVMNVVLIIYVQVVLIGGFSPPLVLIFGLPAAIVAILILVTRWRWAPLLAVLYGIFLLALGNRSIRYDLSHPQLYQGFALTLLNVAVAVVGIVSGVGATIQNYRTHTATELEHARSRPLHVQIDDLGRAGIDQARVDSSPLSATALPLRLVLLTAWT